MSDTNNNESRESIQKDDQTCMRDTTEIRLYDQATVCGTTRVRTSPTRQS